MAGPEMHIIKATFMVYGINEQASSDYGMVPILEARGATNNVQR